jgi:hypothetical protein
VSRIKGLRDAGEYPSQRMGRYSDPTSSQMEHLTTIAHRWVQRRHVPLAAPRLCTPLSNPSRHVPRPINGAPSERSSRVRRPLRGLPLKIRSEEIQR